ncbi:MAG: trypsin-like serine protease [Deltaproteobacteria bacterium]|nr:trypsin-like serine protease [Deltaproteobacteria bacterium]
MNKLLAPVLVSLSMLTLPFPLSCGPAGEPEAVTGSVSAPIVNGDVETGWPAVGALVIDFPGWGYQGSICSGTLIAPRWVLTAGHCVSSTQSMPIMPFFVKFYIGNDARDSGSGQPATGALYQADAFFPYPDYDPNALSGGNDLGLVKLKDEVSGVEPVKINTIALRGEDLDDQVLYVGFGISDGKNNTGSGIKRSTHMPITWIENDAYYTEPQGSGTCHGDSGGPGLLEMAPGQWKAMGIVSAGTEPPGEGDPCLTGFGIYTRVDAYASWIADVTGIALPDCSDGDECVCDEACLPDGGCDNTQCFDMSCTEALGCVSRCEAFDSGCALDCRMLTRQDAQVELDKLTYCMENKCPSAVDALGCAQQHCGANLEKCIADADAGDDCNAFDACLRSCPDGNTLCAHVCGIKAEPTALQARKAVADCLEQQCGLGTDPDARISDCARDKCPDLIDACFPAPACDQPGGSCPEGTECAPGPQGGVECVPIQEPDAGASCQTSDACGDAPGDSGDTMLVSNAATNSNGCSSGHGQGGSPWAILIVFALATAGFRLSYAVRN